ncbi:Acetyltransferase (GNAT) family protein [Lishizhenia tianjinensis]|uniref:Acetyltransferase (GNAT) family protein n=1 Tax=Lishizhenia tianjinensis TaxID=477690 RepID=A0A1I6XH16_9FLAO|nr:GNAT family N-acetyltransferase [Lishizhenia tianjinensis]SFT37456.1 Acetyltransferase (GNAT) family protein [Lishizhenia tianjinensis]
MKTFNKHFQKTEELDHLVHYMILEVIPEINISKSADLKLDTVQIEDAESYFNNWLTVGEKWNWVGRIIAGEAALKEDLSKDTKHIFNIQLKEETIGLCEYEIKDGNCEIIYFGLKEAFIGKGWAKKAFELLLHRIYQHDLKRVWLHTCSLDAPQAKVFYRNFGFRTYKIQKERVTLWKQKKEQVQ